MKSRVSSGIFWWNVFIRKFQFINAFQGTMLVLIKTSLGKSSHMQRTIFGQNQKQTYLDPSYQDANGKSKHSFARTRFRCFFCSRQGRYLILNFSHPSGRHVGQRLLAAPYFPSSVKRITGNISNLVRENNVFSLLQKRWFFLCHWLTF